MSSRPETSTHTTGAHRALRRAPRSVAQRPPARYEPYLDGLFTYCLSVLCDHDAATEVLGDVLALSERQYGRCPSGAGERKAWLYALARWACLRKLTEQRRTRPGAHTGHREPAPEPGPAPPSAGTAPGTAERRRSELALLAWPEAAGTTPEQREVLELVVRHRLDPRDVAAVLSKELAATRELLSSAACEVERTRAALAVVDTCDCPSVARLTGDHHVLLSAALRRELVRHVDDCPRCRRAAERAEAAGPWPGSRTTQPSPPGPAAGAAGAADATEALSVGTAPLPLVEAPRGAAYTAMVQAPRARATAPRFGRNGYPMDPKDRAARRDRLRARAVTTTVVATVVAAPVLALWAAYRGAPGTGEGRDGASVSAGETAGPPALDGHPYDDPYERYGNHGNDENHENHDHYENAGATRNRPGAPFTEDSRAPGVAVEILSDGTGASGAGHADPGGLTVEARPAGATTLITLRASGGERVSWTAGTRAPWITLSRHYGTLAPGESVTVRVYVDHAREPAGPWSARIALYPAGAAVRIHGYGTRPPLPGRPDHSGRPGHPAHPGPPRPAWTGPTAPGGSSAPGSADPTGPGPENSGPGLPGPGSPSQSPPDPDPPDQAPATSSAAGPAPSAEPSGPR
ncbi:hypothetical protein ACIQ7D_24635 [Streptomyces sp. NPDC096310]|uniref:hypothetical protein n=1 Tax=Streptomyces sp. NPDC096310 TaxID=3366082 RepID=UPI00382B3A26